MKSQVFRRQVIFRLIAALLLVVLLPTSRPVTKAEAVKIISREQALLSPPLALQALTTVTPTQTTYLPLIMHPGYGSHGIVGNYFWVRNPSATIGQDIWFEFQVTNSTDVAVVFSVLAAHIDNGPSAQSWTNTTLQAHHIISWQDHINIVTPGTYQMYLGICYDGKDACLANLAAWDRLSGDVTVTVQ